MAELVKPVRFTCPSCNKETKYTKADHPDQIKHELPALCRTCGEIMILIEEHDYFDAHKIEMGEYERLKSVLSVADFTKLIYISRQMGAKYVCDRLEFVCCNPKPAVFVTMAYTEQKPRDGGAVVCAYCGRIILLVIDKENVSGRFPNTQEIRKLSKNKYLWNAIEQLQRQVRSSI